MSINLKTLIGKLDESCRRAAEQAANLCLARGHYEVDLEHLLLALIDQPASDFVVIARQSGVSLERLERDLDAELSRLRAGNTRTPVFSARLPTLFEGAWLIASLDARVNHVRSGHLLLALLAQPELSQVVQRVSGEFAHFRVDAIKHDFAAITRGSVEAATDVDSAMAPAGTDEARAVPAVQTPRKTPALDRFTDDLTARARQGRLDPVIGREAEIRQVIDVLMRRRQNNPILTGEAGVGKTAIVEGLAIRIVGDDVPPPLQGVALRTLDIGLLQAGASVKGEFEGRLKAVIDEVKQSATPIILFIDEAHAMIGAGGAAGQGDAANLLKPALARGELRTVAATTWSEYKKYFEKDAALARRFQVVKVDEPDEELAAAMLRGIVPLMEGHFNVRVLDDAVSEACRLSHRYISGRQLPDKAVGVLDTACARVALAQSSTPAVIDDARKRLARIGAEITALEREAATGSDHAARLVALRADRAGCEKRLAVDEARWQAERGLIDRIGKLRIGIEKGGSASALVHNVRGKRAGPRRKKARGGGSVDPAVQQLRQLQSELTALQGESPLVPVEVDGAVVAAIVAAWTGIPLGRMVKDEIGVVRRLESAMRQRVIGQDHALAAIAQRVRTARANMEDPNKPRGVFLFIGPSGVGKTETALALAEILYGGERKLITINMSEYQEAHTVSGLKGSPPGYVGYGEGGVLTEAVRRSPYSVVLLDEIEKAHPDVLELFFQVFDKGVLDDAEGREVDFRNTLIILTSNVGSPEIMRGCLSQPAAGLPTAEALYELVRPALYKAFKPAFLGRLQVVPYYPIPDDVLAKIIRLKLDRIGERVLANHRAHFSWDDGLIDVVLARCTEVDSGARNVDHILNGSLLPEVADTVLARMAEGRPITSIRVRADKSGSFKYTVR